MLSVILINFNNSRDTIDCLKSLKQQYFKNFEIIIIDNKSNTYNRKLLDNFIHTGLSHDFKKKIRLINLKINLGYTGGNNFGIRKSKGNIILFLNSDTLHSTNFLGSMVSFFEKYKEIHIAQPKICLYPNTNIIWGNGGKITKFSYNLFSIINYMDNDKNLTKTPFRIDYALGTAFFIRRDVIEDIGLFDDIYFMYCEESDLCYRAVLKGYNNIYCNPNTKIFHNRKPGLSVTSKKLYFRNRMIFCLKNFSIPVLIWQFLMQIIQVLLFTTDLKKKRLTINFSSLQ